VNSGDAFIFVNSKIISFVERVVEERSEKKRQNNF
jgi:hypothetical protein